MELTDRERRILAELEHQLVGEQPTAASPAVRTVDQPAPATAARARVRRTSGPAGMLGLLLIAAGILLGVTSSVLLGLLLVGWWLSPWLRRSLKRAGRFLLNLIEAGVRPVPPGESLIPW